MKKSDLKSGMAVENRKGEMFLAVMGHHLNEIVLINNNSSMKLGAFKNDLISTSAGRYDIVKVFYPTCFTHLRLGRLEKQNLIWEREFRISYLEFEIVNDNNSDGFVLLYNGSSIGNFKELINAKKHAVIAWMIQRPATFGGLLSRRIASGRSTYDSYGILEKAIITERLSIPKEITCSTDSNYAILFNGAEL